MPCAETMSTHRASQHVVGVRNQRAHIPVYTPPHPTPTSTFLSPVAAESRRPVAAALAALATPHPHTTSPSLRAAVGEQECEGEEACLKATKPVAEARRALRVSILPVIHEHRVPRT